jgi:hypothetical protein
MTFIERVAPVVDETIRALGKKSFVVDPIAGVRYSRATSIVSSAYKRHGRIFEVALRESLRESNRHSVWHELTFSGVPRSRCSRQHSSGRPAARIKPGPEDMLAA